MPSAHPIRNNIWSLCSFSYNFNLWFLNFWLWKLTRLILHRRRSFIQSLKSSFQGIQQSIKSVLYLFFTDVKFSIRTRRNLTWVQIHSQMNLTSVYRSVFYFPLQDLVLLLQRFWIWFNLASISWKSFDLWFLRLQINEWFWLGFYFCWFNLSNYFRLFDYWLDFAFLDYVWYWRFSLH